RLPSTPLFPYTTLFRSHAPAPGRPRLRCPGEAARHTRVREPHRSFEARRFPRDGGIRLPPYRHAWLWLPRWGAMATKAMHDDKRSEEHTSELQSRGHLV